MSNIILTAVSWYYNNPKISPKNDPVYLALQCKHDQKAIPALTKMQSIALMTIEENFLNQPRQIN